jgi:hypothetical protein
VKLLLGLLLLGCAAPRVPPLTVRAVEWNPNHVDVGRVAAIAESGEDLFVFGSSGAHVLAAGASVASDPSVVGWRSATTIPAADGNGTWVVGVDDKGRVLRVRDRSNLEVISGRFGLEKSDVHAIAALGPNRVAFALDKALAIVDGDRIHRHDYAFNAIAGGSGHGAGVGNGELRVFDPFRGIDQSYKLDVEFVAIDSRGRVVAANDRAIWREEDGKLTLKYRSPKEAIHGIATSAERVWFSDGEELGVLDGGVTIGLKATGTLVGSPSGDVWTIANGTLKRFSIDTAGTWSTTIAPIYTRVCSGCHGPSGSAGLDLSTPARWDSKREAIKKRVVIDKTMPPPGHPLNEADRQAIESWSRER